MKLQKMCKKVTVLGIMTSIFLFLVNFAASAVITKHADVVFVGEFGSGKTAITSRLLEEEFDYEGRLPGQFEDKAPLKGGLDLTAGIRTECIIWDTPGKETMREQIMANRVSNANVVVVVIDSANGDPSTVVTRAFTEWLLLIRKRNNRDARILFVFNKLDILRENGNAEDVLERCCSIMRGLSTDKNTINSLYISSMNDYCVSSKNEIIAGSVRANLLKTIKVALCQCASSLPMAESRRVAICPKCRKESPPKEVLNGKCRECRRHVCNNPKCNGSSAPSICYEGEGSTVRGEKDSDRYYCCEKCRKHDEECVIM